MFFKPNLGMQGNIEESLKQNNQTSNRIFKETNERRVADEAILAQTDETAISLYEAQQEQEEALIQADEVAISLYESQEAQETINAQQDEALVEIYEMLG